MSSLMREVDLTQYGCPLHYIKAREAVNKLTLAEEIHFLVNTGDAVTDVMNSLRQDGHFCELEQQSNSVTRLKVIKQ